MDVPILAAEEDFLSAARQMSRWLERVLSVEYHRYPLTAGGWRPPVNVYEDGTAYWVVAELAGIEAHEISLRMEGNRLILSGQRTVPRPPGDEAGRRYASAVRLHVMEIDHGPFQRIIELPEPVCHERIEASLGNGFLWVKLPKRAG
ncbi:MAG: hypothetical protein B1H04_00435 [Planctomycetales bacterium 4484_123]|nr:MAG: hypothetical protein B1H04_00435 [Planctomycetales bacterium 4484_123]